MADAARLDASGSAILDGTGYGTVRLAPAGEKWEIRRSRVECSTNTLEAVCRLYQGRIASSAVVDGTEAGSTGDTSDTVFYLEDGQALFVEWSGGDPGATATVTVSGWKSMPEGGFRAVH